jgi:hypothetical protein
VTWNWFDRFVLALILLNTLCMALTDYSVVDAATLEPAAFGVASACSAPSTLAGGCAHDTSYSFPNHLNEVAEHVFTALFVVELALKTLAMGFCVGPGTYLQDAWNWLDFVVVLAGLAAWSELGYTAIVGSALPELGVQLSGLRTLRVLRPLRSLNAIPALKNIVQTLLASIPDLANVALLLGFVFLIFGILACQLWSGTSDNRCRLTEFPVRLDNPGDLSRYFEAAAMLTPLSDRDAAGQGRVRPRNATVLAAAQAFVDSVVANRSAFPFCAGDDGARLVLDDDAWTQISSPWATSRQCVWPIDREDWRSCSATVSATDGAWWQWWFPACAAACALRLPPPVASPSSVFSRLSSASRVDIRAPRSHASLSPLRVHALSAAELVAAQRERAAVPEWVVFARWARSLLRLKL